MRTNAPSAVNSAKARIPAPRTAGLTAARDSAGAIEMGVDMREMLAEVADAGKPRSRGPAEC